ENLSQRNGRRRDANGAQTPDSRRQAAASRHDLRRPGIVAADRRAARGRGPRSIARLNAMGPVGAQVSGADGLGRLTGPAAPEGFGRFYFYFFRTISTIRG